ncbi:MAG: cytochrome c [Bacteroidota bacterium]|nr:cytochrome c [Bacteroidota bacterium]
MEFRKDTDKKKKINIYKYFRDLEKFYGILYMLFLVFLIYLGVKYVRTLDYNRIYTAPVLLAADSNMRVPLTVKRGTVSPPVDVLKLGGELPADLSASIIGKGQGLYNTNCASCHGETGQGNGPAGATLNPPPRNFVDPSKQIWKNGPKISNMYVTLQEGIANTGMASFSNITPEDRFAIIHYVQTFNPTYPKDNPDSLSALDLRYSLSTGVKSPNQISLELAMQLIILNSDTLSQDLKVIASKIASDKTDTSALVFKSIVLNEPKALNSLASNMIWNENADEFVKFLRTDPVDKGFKASVYELSPEKADKVYQYLKNLFVKNKV